MKAPKILNILKLRGNYAAAASFVVMLFAMITTSAAETVETLDMQQIEGAIGTFDGKTLTIKIGDGVKKISVKDLAELVLQKPKNAKSAPGTIVLQTVCGDIIPVKNLTLDKDQFTLQNPLLGKVALKMDKVKVIFTPAENETPQDVIDSCTANKYKQGLRDMLVIVRKNGVLQSARGVLKSVGREKIGFQLKGKDRRISRASVRAIWLSETPQKPAAPRGVLIATDGTRIKFTALKFDGKTVEAESWVFGKLKFNRQMLSGVRFVSDRVVTLSELKPTDVKEHGFFDSKTYPYRIDLSTTGKPITLGGKVYITGLGLHSYSQITYAIDKKYRTFFAIVGIDDNANSDGEASITILGDGKKLLPETQLTAAGKPVAVRLNVTGVKELTIIVDSGSDKLPVGDHVDIVGARLIK
ncbi:MAG: NPCBM/NEW2 domain-containing protein [Phycisphaerae bacterium]|nr:NPCBM/NEW2 domain-containing protein [Phycisphaerae bacterium]